MLEFQASLARCTIISEAISDVRNFYTSIYSKNQRNIERSESKAFVSKQARNVIKCGASNVTNLSGMLQETRND